METETVLHRRVPPDSSYRRVELVDHWPASVTRRHPRWATALLVGGTILVWLAILGSVAAFAVGVGWALSGNGSGSAPSGPAGCFAYDQAGTDCVNP